MKMTRSPWRFLPVQVLVIVAPLAMWALGTQSVAAPVVTFLVAVLVSVTIAKLAKKPRQHHQ